MGMTEEAICRLSLEGRVCAMYEACPRGSLSGLDEGGRLACLSGSKDFWTLCLLWRMRSLTEQAVAAHLLLMQPLAALF